METAILQFSTKQMLFELRPRPRMLRIFEGIFGSFKGKTSKEFGY